MGLPRGEAATARGELFECAAVISVAPTGEDGLERFAQVAEAIARAWPGAAPAIRELFDGLTRSSPGQVIVPLRKSFAVARALP